MSDFFYFLKVFFIAGIAIASVALVIYFGCSFFESSFTKTEDKPSLSTTFEDIQYKGHTYIYVSAPYSHTIVHAEHCKCKK